MKKNDYYMMKPLSGEEHVQVSGGYVPPTEEQMEELRKIYGPLAVDVQTRFKDRSGFMEQF